MSASVWSSLSIGSVDVDGDVRRRAEANWSRLQYEAFREPGIYVNVDSDDWPGDWVSRTLHANVLLSRSLGKGPESAAAIVSTLRAHMNERGYFGEVIDPDALNEQQIGSPHGWLMRGLVEYHRWTGDEEALDILNGLVDQIAIPLAQWWDSYPLTLAERGEYEGEMVGLATWRSGRWHLSSDIGNQFMVLDGMTHVYSYRPSDALRASIDAGFQRFRDLDLVKTNVQTHATLTTTRALLRMHEATGEASYLELARERYGLYRREAMTENYANNNWFGRPDTWTEPCAIIDSFVAAFALWRATEDSAYLEDAHLIWFNAIQRGQRGNGGFGCDTCAGFESVFIEMRDYYEAFFCCTQRGGEGHATAIHSLYHTSGSVVAATFYSDSVAQIELDGGTVSLRQRTGYPVQGGVELTVEEVSADLAPIELRLFVPQWWSDVEVSVNGVRTEVREEGSFVALSVSLSQGDVIRLDAQTRTWSRTTINPTSIEGYRVHHWGPLLLAHAGREEVHLPAEPRLVPTADGAFAVEGTPLLLRPLGDAIEYPPSKDPIRTYEQGDYQGRSPELIAEVDGLPRQVLFAG